MRKIIVAGIGTDVGKTVVSAIISKALQADYWKPVQCGCTQLTDRQTVADLVADSSLIQHPSNYIFRFAGSPHYAAELENMQIEPGKMVLPKHLRPLVIESAGGLCVPFTDAIMQIDVFAAWGCEWILVSKDYIGSINHSLLTLEALKSRGQQVAGVIFNGPINPGSERVILQQAKAPMLGRLLPEEMITAAVVTKYAHMWKEALQCVIK